MPERCRAAEDRQCPGQAAGALAELADPPQHRPGDRFRRQALHVRPCVPATRRAQCSGQGFEQERVPAGAGVARLAQLRIRLFTEPLPQECGGRLAAERPQPQRRARRAGTQLVQHPRLVRAAAHGEQQGDWQAVDPGREMREPAQRRHIRPVRVIHGDHQRTARRQVRGQPVQAVHGCERNVVLDRSGTGPVEHARGEPGRAVQERVPLPGPGRDADRLDELADDAIRKAALQGQPAGGQDPRAELTRAGAGRAEQGGLADPGGSFHQHEGAVSRFGGAGGGHQHR